jgi:hypothetical protein
MHKQNGGEIALRLDIPAGHQRRNPPIVIAASLLHRVLVQ